jgi:hypothetical protein
MCSQKSARFWTTLETIYYVLHLSVSRNSFRFSIAGLAFIVPRKFRDNEYELKSTAVRIVVVVAACMGFVVNVAPYRAESNVTVYV